MKVDNLIKLKNEMLEKDKRLDIIGETGKNIYNEENKKTQLIKYNDLFDNLNYLKKNNKEYYESLIKELKMEENINEKICLFITDGNFENFYKNEKNKIINDEKKEKLNFMDIQKTVNINFLPIYMVLNKNMKENYLIEKLLLDYDSLDMNNKKEDDFCLILKNIKKQKLENYIKLYKYELISKKLDNVEKNFKIEDIFQKYLNENKVLLTSKFMQDLFDIKNKIIESTKIDITKLKMYEMPDKKLDYNYKINIIIFFDEEQENIQPFVDKNIFVYQFSTFPRNMESNNELIPKTKLSIYLRLTEIPPIMSCFLTAFKVSLTKTQEGE